MNRTAAPSIPELLKEVQALLNEKCRRRKFRLQVPQDGYRIEDDLVVVAVDINKGTPRAYDFVEVLSKVQDELRARGHEDVLLVPTLND